MFDSKRKLEQKSNLWSEFSANAFARQEVRKGAIFPNYIFDPVSIEIPAPTLGDQPIWFGNCANYNCS
jgi:hypothetical protein